MSVERGLAPVGDRLQILGETMRSFVLAATEPRTFAATVARRTAEALGAYCALAVISDDGAWLHPAAAHDADAAAVERIGRLMGADEEVRREQAHPMAEAARTGNAVEVAGEGHAGAAFVPLRALGETVGCFCLVRHGAGASGFSGEDLVFARSLADHAALAMNNARLLAAMQRELGERIRMAERLRLLAALTREFLGVTGDPGTLLATVARRVAEVVGTACSINLVDASGEYLEPLGATYDPEPERSSIVQREISARPQRVGEGVSGRVAATGESILLPRLDEAFFARLDPRYRALGATLGVTSLLAVALRERERVAGVIVVYRRTAGNPYTDDDRVLLEDIAGRASLALANSRLIEASRRELVDRMRTEEVLRRGFLEAAPDPVVIFGERDGNIVLVNSQTEAMFGHGRAALVGKPVELLVPRLRLDEPHQELMATRRDGSRFAAEVSLSFIETPEGRLVAASVRDVTERRRELEERNRRTEEANRLKSEFLANMSHELRTPLNAIIGFAALMHAGKAGPMADVQREYLGDILTSSRHLRQLIDDVLDLAKIESGKLEVRPEPVELHRVVVEVRDIVRGLAAEKRLQLDLDVGVATAVLDPRMLKQILYNFLSNAIKFTDEGGKIALRIAAVGDHADELRIDVEDSGIGIRAEDMNRLFVEFQQLDASPSKRYAGTGLGLALTRRLAEAHGGRVEVSSTFGRGSTFSAILPREVKRETRGT